MTQTLNIGQSLIIALWIGLVLSRVSLATLQLRYGTLMTALVVGIVMGDIPAALAAGVGVQLALFNVGGAGGAASAEPAVAAAIAVPVAIMSGLDPAQAAAVGVPIGILGSYLYQFRFFINTYLLKLADKEAEKGHEGRMTLTLIILPLITSLLVIVPVIFVTLYFGAPLVASFAEKYLVGTVAHVMSVIGGGLAAAGLAAGIVAIGKEQYLIFFVAAYFLSVNLPGINILTFAILSVVVATMYITARDHDKLEALKNQ